MIDHVGHGSVDGDIEGARRPGGARHLQRARQRGLWARHRTSTLDTGEMS